jgi:hypothetical protein
MRRPIIVASLALIGVAGASGASGYVLRKQVDIPVKGVAAFHPSMWACRNHGTTVECFQGDAYPYVELTSSKRGLTVIVHTLRDPQGGHITRTYAKDGKPVYVFTAL